MDVLDAARALGVAVITDAAAVTVTEEAVRVAPPPSPEGPVPWEVLGGSLRCLWTPTPTPAEVTEYARQVGMPVEVVLAPPAVLAEVAGRSAPERSRRGSTGESILTAAIREHASDVHLSPGLPPMIRVGGTLAPLDGFEVLSAETTAALGRWMTTDSYDGDRDLAFSFGGARFRANIYSQQGSVAIACRALPMRVPDIDDLGLPASIRHFAELHHGLVLLCGPTGSGKSTTLAALVDLINRSRPAHITTIEDPVEYVHVNDRAVIHQREVGRDVASFSAALRSALRQDPDVLLVGEMRDPETVDAALTAAETGHLVLSTLHTGDAESSVGRIVHSFPEARQGETRARLATVLRGVVCQKLLPRVDRPDAVAVVCEVLINTRAIASLIRTGETHQLRSMLETGSREGMQTFEQALASAVAASWLDPDVGRASAHDDRSYAGHLVPR